MKRLIFILLLACLSAPASSQYGRLEPIAAGDTSLMVLRTPNTTIEKLSQSTDKNERKIGATLQSLERHLDMLRAEYNLGRSTTSNVTFLVNSIKRLENFGIDVSNYVQEAVMYTKQKRKNAAY